MVKTHMDDLDFAIEDQYYRYNGNTFEEMSMLRTRLRFEKLEPVFGRFSNLLEFKMVNGRFSLSNGQIVREKLDGPNSIPVPSDIDLRPRGEGLWWADSFCRGMPYVYRFPTGMIEYARKHHRIKELEINHLPFQYFKLRGPFHQMMCRSPSMSWALTRLSLTITFYSSTTENPNNNALYCRDVMKQGMLRAFLQKLPELVDLSISTVCVNGQYHTAPELTYVIPFSLVNVKLRRLHLDYFETSEPNFTYFLRSNARTLKVLELQNMYMINPSASWARLFDSFRRNQKCLQSAKFSGIFCDSSCYPIVFNGIMVIHGYQNGWNFEMLPTLGPELERFLIHGGPCPLRQNDKGARFPNGMVLPPCEHDLQQIAN